MGWETINKTVVSSVYTNFYIEIYHMNIVMTGVLW